MKPTLLTILGTLLLFPLPPLTAAETKPNIVFILADDLGYGSGAGGGGREPRRRV